jgi:hypothetical protein
MNTLPATKNGTAAMATKDDFGQDKSLTPAQLADAMRAGLESRRSLLPPFSHFSPAQFTPETRKALQSHADLERLPPLAKQGLLEAPVRGLRRVLKTLLRPWLAVQTQFNQLTLAVLENLHREIGALHARVDQSQVATPNGAVAAGDANSAPHSVLITERILEPLFVHTRLPAPPGLILDLGGSDESLVLELAGYGYRVDCMGRSRLTVPHPALTLMEASLDSLPFPDAHFNAAIGLSILAGAGLASEGPIAAETDPRVIVAEVLRVMLPGGRFLLSVPWGRAATTEAYQVYDATTLEELLHPFLVRELLVGIRTGDSWSITADSAEVTEIDSTSRINALALVVAERP